ncbi:MAG: butyrate kinase, partial [bacterium]|nr:butyrate kinase [bacterium]
MPFSVLVINPGSTSTKLALWGEAGALREETLDHAPEEMAAAGSVSAQLPTRLAAVQTFLSSAGDPAFDAVAGRGGPLRPLEGGSYRVDEDLLADLRSARWGEHASLLGGLLAEAIATERGLPAFVVDPVTVDELDPVARISGVPEIQRLGRGHALSLKAVSRLAAAEIGKPLTETRFTAAHLGGGISVAALRGGRIVDVNAALRGMGPFSPFRAGALPLRGLLDLVYSQGESRGSIEKKLSTESGLFGYLGTGDLVEVEKRIATGDEQAATIFAAMVYQIAKELGAM